MKRALGIITLCAVLPLATGCGTVINGWKQDLAVTSSPGGATVTIDGVPSGTTPVVVPVKRSHAHVVKVEQPGYYPIEASVVPGTSAWEWLNVFNGFIIGFAIDAWTGGMYDLSHDIVSVSFPTNSNRLEKVAAAAPVPAPAPVPSK